MDKTIYLKGSCRKCKKPMKLKGKLIYGLPTFKNMFDCGNHKKEFEKVKTDYHCYVDFLYGKKIKKV